MNKDNLIQQDKNREKIDSFIIDNPVCMMTTICDVKGLDSRPMHTIEVDFMGNIYFYINLETIPVVQIENNKTVHLSYNNKKSYLSITGKSEIQYDRAVVMQYWDDSMKTLIGLEYEDPRLAVLKVTPEYADYWETPGAIKQALSKIKSTFSKDEELVVKKEELK